MEGERQSPSAASFTVSKVLDDDDLLIEILLRVGFPTTLVCAALVCKRWLKHASDPKFLRCFRKLHPPRLLGFYVVHKTARFVPMLPQSPEFATVLRRASRSLEIYPGISRAIRDCRNGSIFLDMEMYKPNTRPSLGVLSALCPERGLAAVPPFPPLTRPSHDNAYHFSKIFSGEDIDGGGLSYWYLVWEMSHVSTVRVYMLQDGLWSLCISVTAQLPNPRRQIKVLFANNKIYMLADLIDIIVLDLTVSSLSTIQLPEGVEYGSYTTVLTRVNDTFGVYLIVLKQLQLHIWLHKGDNWLLVNTICLREMCAKLRMSDDTVEDEHTAVLKIMQVGDNAEFVFFRMGRSILYLDIKCRTLCKVYEVTERDWCFYICPLKMVWPPIFPVLQG